MASSYTDLGTELMTTGENAGTWGSTTNTNIQILEEAVRGYVAVSANSDQTLSLTDGSTGDSIRNMVIALTGTLSANRTITVPAIEKMWVIDNQTAGAYTLTIKASGQTGVTWAATDKGTKILYANGTDVIDTDIGGVGSYDLNGEELTLDADSDTSITASTDDQIDFEIAGADDFTMTANAFNVLTGSHATFADSANAKFGTSDDMLLYHDGSNSYITNAVGALKIATETSGIALTIGHTTSETTIADNLTTTGDTSVGGTLGVTGVATFATHVALGDSDILKLGAGTDLTLYHDGSNSYITNAVGALKIATETSGIALTIGHTTSETTIADNLTTTGDTSVGGTLGVTGVATFATHVALGDSDILKLGAGTDLTLYHDGTNSYITNAVGALKIATETSGIALTIGHTTSETTIADNLTTTGDTSVGGTLGVSGVATFATHVALGESDILKLGAGTDLTLYHDGSNSYITNAVGALKVATETSGIAVTIGHTVSETTIADNLTVTGTLTGTLATAAQGSVTSLGTLTTLTVDNIITNGTTIGHTDDTDLITLADGAVTVAGTIGSGAITSTGIVTGTAFTAGSAVLAEAELELLDGLTAGTAIASKVVTTDSSIDTTGQRNLTISGELDAATLDISSSIDIAGASQFSGAITVGVDDTGLDVKLFGASAGAYMEWDESIDTLRIVGASADATTSTGKLLLATSLTNINASDVLGKIDFQAPLEAGGTDAITVAASIRAIAQGTFSASVNATDLIFFTGHSEAATEKFRFTSEGEIGIGGANYGTDGQVLTSAGAGAAPAWEDVTGSVTAINNATANELVTIGSTTTELDAEANLTFDGTDVLVGGAGKLQLRDTALFINSSTDGQLDIDADTEVEITATTVDLNGIFDVSGVIVAGGQISAADGTAGAPSISNTGDLNTGFLFSAADTMQFSSGGTAQVTFQDGAIVPVTDDDVDLGTASLQFKDVYIDGTLEADAITIGGSAVVSSPITALNNATANELVTVGATTTELEAEANLTFDGTDVLLGGAGKLQLRDTGLYVASNADGDLDVVSDGTAVDSINLESAGGITLDAGTASSGIVYEDDGTEMLRIHNSSSDVIVESKVSDKDIIFKVNDGGSATEVARFDGDVSALLLASGKKLMIGAAEEYVSGDGTDITFVVGSGGDINIGSAIGVTFGDDGEKIEGDGTDLTISASAALNLTATTDIVVPANVGITFGSGEKIEGDSTDLTDYFWR